MNQSRTISWFPSHVDVNSMPRFEIHLEGRESRPYVCVQPGPDDWAKLGESLRQAHRKLQRIPVSEIVKAVDRTCESWSKRDFPHRVRARADMAATTGFSPEAIDRSIDVELANYRTASLTAALRREFSDPRALDTFTGDEQLNGQALALGPQITLVLLTGNVPGLAALPLIRALLVKSAVIAKVASGEPTFAAHFLRSLSEVRSELAEAIAITYWSRDDHAALDGALEQVDGVVAYGGVEACAAIRARLRPHQRYVEHGHKYSLGIVTQQYLAENGLTRVARSVAADVSTFNQHACIAPQAYLVEQGEIDPIAFASEVAHAMEAYAAECPLGAMSPDDAAALQMRRASAKWDSTNSRAKAIWSASGLDWTVLLDTDLGAGETAGNRVVRIVPVIDTAHILSLLQPISRYLQNVGLGAAGEQFRSLSTELARLGACRISEPGSMSKPSMIWRHDGHACIAALVRWCDIEMHRETNSTHAAGSPMLADC
jgi:Acyl-CoA reductase (LuxC)